MPLYSEERKDINESLWEKYLKSLHGGIVTKWGHNDHTELVICKRGLFQLGALITALDRVTKESYCITALFCVMTVGDSFADYDLELKSFHILFRQ